MLTIMAAATLLMVVAGGGAEAAIVPTVQLATAGEYAVLAGSEVANTGNSTLNGSLGVSPGTSITGFPPGTVVPPAVTNKTNAAAAQAQADLTKAYDDAAGRPVNATTTADLVNLTLVGGVYHGPDKSPLSLSGTLTLDGQNNPSSVFIFQTNSTLITATGSTVNLINGALECNVFWQVGSSATLGSGSTFRGNILALTAITVENGVVVHGRALARNAEVTLINDTFVKPTCADQTPPSTTSSSTVAQTTTTSASGATTTQAPRVLDRTPTGAGADAGTAGGSSAGLAQSTNRAIPAVVGVPKTGGSSSPGGRSRGHLVLLAGLVVELGVVGVILRGRAKDKGARPQGR